MDYCHRRLSHGISSSKTSAARAIAYDMSSLKKCRKSKCSSEARRTHTHAKNYQNIENNKHLSYCENILPLPRLDFFVTFLIFLFRRQCARSHSLPLSFFLVRTIITQMTTTTSKWQAITSSTTTTTIVITIKKGREKK